MIGNIIYLWNFIKSESNGYAEDLRVELRDIDNDHC